MEETNFLLDRMDNIGCGCAACQQGLPEVITYGQEEWSGTTFTDTLDAPTNDANPNIFANYLTHGYWQDTGQLARSWSQETVTFSISNNYNAAQKEGLRDAFDLWSDVADINFNEVSSSANISIVTNNNNRAYSSSSVLFNGNISSNTISIDNSFGGWSNIGTFGNYGFMTALHEIGHSLGLGHTANYNGSASYNTDAQWTNDTHQTTLMSYFQDTNVGSDHWNSTNIWQYSATPMLIDILAIQNIYGVNNSTRNGNTTYGFNSNAGRDQFDFSITEVPIAIWDGGGIDTLDVSGYSTNQTIYLESGRFSSTGSMTNNIVIAYGAVIENATGGAGDDTIHGNDANNTLLGGSGNDSFFSSLGDDIIDGQNDTDSVTYSYSVTDFAFNFINNTTVVLTHMVQNFTDTLRNIENFIFSGESFSFTDLEVAHGDREPFVINAFDNTNTLYKTQVSESGSINITNADTGFAGSGTQFSTSISNNILTVNIPSSSPVNILKLYGTQIDDHIIINASSPSLEGRIEGGQGNDVLEVFGNVTARILGEDGNDTIRAGTGRSKLYGGDGADSIFGSSDNDYIYGDAGADIINSGAGNDRIFGGTGDDNIEGVAGNDGIYGGDGADTILGGEGSDRIQGDDGNDVIFGGNNGDRLLGNNGDDQISGGDGADTIYGHADNDVLNGDGGSDKIFGGLGNDTLNGGDRNDNLNGDDGHDRLNGDAGTDRIFGGNGDDTLVGGAGNDRLNGDAGQDVFGFVSIDGSIDQIRDFTLNGTERDALNITDVLDGYNEATDDINNFAILSFKHTGRTDLFINADGEGTDWEQVAVIRGSDFSSTTIDDLVSTNQLIIDDTLL